MNLKRTVLILLLLINSIALAQPWAGPKVAGNVSKVFGLDSPNKIKMGFSGGAFLAYPLPHSFFSFQQEMLFSTRSVITKNALGESVRINNRYLDFPVMVNWHLKDHFYIQSGIMPSVNLYLKDPTLSDSSIYTNGNVNPLHLYYFVGCTYTFPSHFGIGMRIHGGTIRQFDSTPGMPYFIQFFTQYNLHINHKHKKSPGEKPWYSID